LYWQARYADAEASFRESIGLRPDYARAHGALGEILAEQHRYAESETAYRAAIRINPESRKARTALGSVLLAQRRYAEAVEACREAIRLNFDEAHAHLDLWDALEARGRVHDVGARGPSSSENPTARTPTRASASPCTPRDATPSR